MTHKGILSNQIHSQEHFMQQLLQSANLSYVLKVSYVLQHNSKRTAY